MSEQHLSGPRVGILMGSASDWPTMEKASAILDEFGVKHECKVLSAHRSPHESADYAQTAESRGIAVLIAGAGGAAHLAGAIAAHTTLPVLGVPIGTSALLGLDSLLSTVQMPGGIPVATLAIGDAGAKNAGLFAIAILAATDAGLRPKLKDYREGQRSKVLKSTLPPGAS